MTAAEQSGLPAGIGRRFLRLADPRKLDRNWAELMVFLSPALIVYAVFTAYPVMRTFWNSFFTITPRNGNTFVGFENYHEILFNDPVFWKAVQNTAVWSIAGPIMDVFIGVALALAIYSGIRFGRFFRIIWFTPVLISYVVVGILWMWIYNYEWGIANELLRGVGLGGFAQSWLGNTHTALGALIFTHFWKWAGFNMVVCLTALYALPREVLDAAELDNCGWAARTFFVIVPMIRRTLVNLLILGFIGKMKVFDLVWITTAGGPLWATETVSTYVYKRAFNWNTFDLGYPSALGALWSVVILTLVLFISWLFRQRDRLEY